MKDLTLKQRLLLLPLKQLKISHLKESVSVECLLNSNKRVLIQMSVNLQISLNLVMLIKQIYLSNIKELNRPLKSMSHKKEESKANNRMQAKVRIIKSTYAP